jgi:hypothetical protein
MSREESRDGLQSISVTSLLYALAKYGADSGQKSDSERTGRITNDERASRQRLISSRNPHDAHSTLVSGVAFASQHLSGEMPQSSCAPELMWTMFELSAGFSPRAGTALADEACDLIRNLVCDVYSV